MKGYTLPTAEAALAHMRECDATSLLIVTPGKEPDSKIERVIKSRCDLARQLGRHDHLSATSRMALIWEYAQGSDSMRFEFDYCDFEATQGALLIQEGTATFTYRYRAYRPVWMSTVILPNHRLRRPESITLAYGALELRPQPQTA